MPSVNLISLANANSGQRKFADTACKSLERIVNRAAFIRDVRTASYSWRRFRDYRGRLVDLTNDAIVQLIVDGRELRTDRDGELDLEVALARLKRGTVGVVRPPSPVITTNMIFFRMWARKNDYLTLAAHWMHEWIHVTGFRHRSKTPNRNDVSYKIGALVVHHGRTLATADRSSTLGASRIGEGYFDLYEAHANDVEEDEG